MKILIDMNLSPDWTAVLTAENIEAAHWSSVGKRDAPDEEIMQYARENGCAVFTHDLDFGAMLALTQSGKSERFANSRPRRFAQKHRSNRNNYFA